MKWLQILNRRGRRINSTARETNVVSYQTRKNGDLEVDVINDLTVKDIADLRNEGFNYIGHRGKTYAFEKINIYRKM